jgi:hypothetical protein
MNTKINNNLNITEGTSRLPNLQYSSPSVVSEKDEYKMIKNKYPYEVLLENAPYSSELEFQLSQDSDDNQMDWWENMTPEQAIQEVQEILDRYTIGSGWVHADEILDRRPNAIKERNELRRVVRYMKKQYKKYYGSK